MGGSQPIGFGLGSLSSGILADTVGWQWAFYVVTTAIFIVLLLAACTLEESPRVRGKSAWKRLKSEVDWVGAIIASVGLAMLSWVLSYELANSLILQEGLLMDELTEQ